MSEIILGENQDVNKDENPFVTPEAGEFHCYLTNIGMILCFETKTDEQGEYWEMPLVLETVAQRNPSTGEVQRSQGFRPLIPITKETKYRPTPNNNMLAVEIFDNKLAHAYRGTVRDIRAQMSGLVIPKQPSVGEDSVIIIGS